MRGRDQLARRHATLPLPPLNVPRLVLPDDSSVKPAGHDESAGALSSSHHAPEDASLPGGPAAARGRRLSSFSIEPITERRLEAAAAHVRSALAKREPLTKLEQQIVAQHFMLEDHLRAIKAVCRFGKIVTSFRGAGEDTLMRMKYGAPTKGKDLHAKTVKLGSLEKFYGSSAQELLGLLREAEISGYVGHWDEQDRLLGLVMGPGIKSLGGEDLPAVPPDKKKPAGKMSGPEEPTEKYHYYPLDLGADGDSIAQRRKKLSDTLTQFKAEGDAWRSQPFIGDYDTHEAAIKEGRWCWASNGSSQEAKVLMLINMATAVADEMDPESLRRPQSFKPDDVLSVARHGTQMNLVSYQMERDPHSTMDEVVANASFPLATCDAGTWKIFRTKSDWDDFYLREKGLHTKDSLRADATDGVGLQRVEGEEGQVRLGRRSSSPSSPAPLSRPGSSASMRRSGPV